MATVYYKVVPLDEYLTDVESQLNTFGADGYELSEIYGNQAILISGSSGITVTGTVTLPAGVVSSSAQLPNGIVSSSTQLPSGIVSSSTQLPAGLVSSSVQVDVRNTTGISTIATTGSNTFIGSQVLSGSLTVSGSSDFKNSLLRITGSTYITGSTTFTGNHTLTGTSYLGGDTTVSGSTALSGSVSVVGNLNIISGSGLYRWGNKQFNYGVFYDTQTQTASLANTAYPLQFNTATHTDGIQIQNNLSGKPTRITFENTGLYNLQFSAQLGNTALTTVTFDVWYRVTGSDVPYSNSQLDLRTTKETDGRILAAWNFVDKFESGSYAEIMWAVSNTTGLIQATGTSSFAPAIPSTILTVTQVA